MEHLDTFLARWKNAGGSERANYQLFLTELCSLLDLPLPEPAGDDTRENAYVFERRVVISQPDGSNNNGFIDLYKRGSFVLEAKQTGKILGSTGWDKAMLKAHNQADQYARALPVEEGRPPFILVVDVGRNIELYAEFSRSGATYTPYPDARSHRIRLEDLRKEEVRERLSAVWLDPLSLDPARRSAKVTREIANQLAKLAKSLEADGHSPQLVSSFLMRALFTMFAEDVGLLPERGFTELLQRLKNKPDTFAPMLEHLWQTMNSGGFSPILESTLLKFNGGLFAEASAIALDRDQMELLLKASEADWRYVEPAIFGTLLERALNPRERHKLGAHYTPRAYVERLVLPAVIEPLRAEWKEVQAAALTYESLGKHKEAVEEVKAFQRHLCDVRVLDPACGSGNFLYVTLEHMKRLEGEVLNLLGDLGQTGMLDTEGLTVDPHQFLGLEINPRAARIAEMVLWIGYLQWHFRTHGKVNPPEPVLRDFHNIEHRDALITYDAVDLVIDESGKPLTRWDGVTTKTSPITGEQVPDESAQVEQYAYRNPRKAEWPEADYIVGNPPFIGNKRMRSALGAGYVDAVRNTWSEIPESADFVMYWWHIAADKARRNLVKNFGFITTNSIKQSFNRRILESHLSDKTQPLSLIFAIPDHPWVDSGDGAAVRISMTVGTAGNHLGNQLSLTNEYQTNSDEYKIETTLRRNKINADLTLGADIPSSKRLLSNRGLSGQGIKLVGDGFYIISTDKITGQNPVTKMPIARNIIGPKDVLNGTPGRLAIDFFGLTDSEAKAVSPIAYQKLLTEVKPLRDQNPRKSIREQWWKFAWDRPVIRNGLKGLGRYIATLETTKHRTFTFIPADSLWDGSLFGIALEDAFLLGILSSRVHTLWALTAGADLGPTPRYNNTICFEPFPFPGTTSEEQKPIKALAERLDNHRKNQQVQHPELTLTGMYNVLEKLRAGEPLNAKEKTIHEQGLVSLLRELHDELDRAVFAAYGWSDLAGQLVGKPGATTPLPDKPEAQAEAEEELLCRLVALNSERAGEEARGHIRWLRPDYQNPSAAVAPEQSEADLDTTTDFESVPAAVAATGKLSWPKQMREQVAAVRHALSQSSLPADALAAQFKRSPKAAVQAVLDALEELGMVQQDADQYRLAS
ncbi:class I SAM-dependent DNA methyltransferase [Pseudomonas oryzihabitans]|uniref:class I SAM-dependent DNA methyltransferase n=1 Tax=Pseudomonas oryzihabitans TaxID=47885 RepID=UPI001F52AA36|nr:DNA methyltransferase [Pseudomonas oryzihabitans]MCI1008256.1 class I SAM-dependent DNA methyltransferase [Pseudomonas oryzihabitans]